MTIPVQYKRWGVMLMCPSILYMHLLYGIF